MPTVRFTNSIRTSVRMEGRYDQDGSRFTAASCRPTIARVSAHSPDSISNATGAIRAKCRFPIIISKSRMKRIGNGLQRRFQKKRVKPEAKRYRSLENPDRTASDFRSALS